MPSQLIDQQYAELMRKHSFGIALYQPVSRDTFRPGSCGYFDKLGAWNPITHLDDPSSLATLGLKPVREDLQRAPVDDGIRWGPKVSEQTKAIEAGISADVDAAILAALPVGAGAVYSFNSSQSSGAVLLTSPPVVHERFYYESPFKNWVKDNAQTLLEMRPEIEDHGLWIVTSTYATRKCAINMWTRGGGGLKVGFTAKAVGLGEIGPSGEWSRDSRDGGWSEHEAKEGDMKVVFFGGLRFRYRWFLGLRQRAGPQLSHGGPVSRSMLSKPERITTFTEEFDDDDEDEDENDDVPSQNASCDVDCEDYTEKFETRRLA